MSIVKRAFGATLICACSISFAAPGNYIGTLYKYRHMPGRTTASYSTLQVLPSHYNGGEVYYAHRFDNDVAIRFGYEQSALKHIGYAFNANEPFIGPPQQVGDYSSINTRIRAFQFDMVGYQDFFLASLEVLGQFGFAMLNADMQAYLYTNGALYDLAPSKGYKFVPRLSLGAQYFFGRTKFGIRIMGDWEGTNLYRVKMTDDDGVRHTIRPFKQSWCVTAGLVFKFTERG